MSTLFAKVNDHDKGHDTSNAKNSNYSDNDDPNLDNSSSIKLEDLEECEEYDDEGEYYEPEDNEKQTAGTISLRNSQSTLDLDLKLIYRQMQFLLQKIGKD